MKIRLAALAGLMLSGAAALPAAAQAVARRSPYRSASRPELAPANTEASR